MKLRNKKTGEIRDIPDELSTLWNMVRESLPDDGVWEDYGELKEYWFINSCGVVEVYTEEEKPAVADMHKQFGNYFETKEEAEKAVEKLKAWKRLKDHNLRIERGQRVFVNADNKLTSQKPLFVVDTYEEVEDDLDLLFEEEE